MDKKTDETVDWRPLLREWKIGLIVATLSIACVCVVVFQMQPYYRAYVQLLVPPRLVDDTDEKAGLVPQQADVLVAKTFTDLVTDDGTSRKVIRDLHLVQNPEFQPVPNWFLDEFAKLVRAIAGGDGNGAFSPAELTNDRVLQDYKGRLKAVSESKDLTIMLSFDARDPHLAEKIVTAHARAFVSGEVEHRRSEFDAKVRWMKAELERTALEARDAQVAIQLNAGTVPAFSRSMSAGAVSDLKMRQLEATGTQTVYESVLKRYQDLVASQNYDGSEIRIVSDATLPTHPAFPKKLLSIAVATLVGAVLGLAAAGTASALRRRIGIERLVGALGLPVLAHVHVPGTFWSGRVKRVERSLFWQRVHELRNALYAGSRRRPVTLVTSALPKEGKSLVASALARSLAGSGSRTLLVDLNARNQHYRLSLDGRTRSMLSLRDYLAGEASAAQAAIPVDGGTPLYLMTNPDGRATDLATLSGLKLRSRFAALKKDFDAVIVDACALHSLSDALLIAHCADDIVLVVPSDKKDLEELKGDLEKLRARSEKVKGVVVVDGLRPGPDDLALIARHALDDPPREVWPRTARRFVFGLGGARWLPGKRLVQGVDVSV